MLDNDLFARVYHDLGTQMTGVPTSMSWSQEFDNVSTPRGRSEVYISRHVTRNQMSVTVVALESVPRGEPNCANEILYSYLRY